MGNRLVFHYLSTNGAACVSGRREGNLVKQQQLAMKLARETGGKQAGGERYGWWTVTTLLLQARLAAAGTSFHRVSDMRQTSQAILALLPLLYLEYDALLPSQ